MEESDLEQVANLENANFESGLALSYQQLIEMWKNKNYEFFGLKIEHNLIGYAIIMKNIDFCELIKIVVAKEWRGNGHAKRLLFMIIKRLNKRIVLEVNAKNINAINLYKSLEFKIDTIRKQYYGINEDAVLMSKD